MKYILYYKKKLKETKPKKDNIKYIKDTRFINTIDIEDGKV
jgi:hypothetical protein